MAVLDMDSLKDGATASAVQHEVKMRQRLLCSTISLRVMRQQC